jgi:hypothetical protein
MMAVMPPSARSAGPAAAPLRYARQVTDAVNAACGGQLRASYLHGSAALGGWTAARSDVDLLLVAADELTEAAITAVGAILVGSGADCPGQGLEASLVTVSQARRAAPPYSFLLHTGPGADGQRLIFGTEATADPDLLMHYAVCLAAGIAVLGPPAAERIGPVPRPVVLRYLAEELGWGLANATEAYAVLNACRAAEYLASGRIVSKVAGGRAALAAGFGPAGLIRGALAEQQGQRPQRRPGPEANRFGRAIQEALRTGASLAPRH